MPLVEDIEDVEDISNAGSHEENGDIPQNVKSSLDSPSEHQAITEGLQQARVFITHGHNMELVEQVETVLQVAEIDYEVAVKEETVAIPVPEKVLVVAHKGYSEA